jgi:hypothetical protein
MPNHTGQLLLIQGKPEIIHGLREFVKTSDDNVFDQNKFMPMPAELVGISSPVRIMSQDQIDLMWSELRMKQVIESEKKREGKPHNAQILAQTEPFALGITKEKSDELKQKYGHDNWYDWVTDIWGTKWGIYEASWVDDNSVSFQSAWSPAEKIIGSLSLKYPELDFVLQAADEGGGFTSEYFIKEGVMVQQDYEWDSEDGIRVRKAVGYYHEDDVLDDSDPELEN